MSDKVAIDKVTIELNREEVSDWLDFDAGEDISVFRLLDGVAAKIKSALPPKVKYAEGTLAWVTAGTGHARHLACLEDGRWWVCGKRHTGLSPIHKIEPLRILGDDEIAISPPSPSPSVWRSNAKHALDCNNVHTGAAGLCDLVADALEAKADG